METSSWSVAWRIAAESLSKPWRRIDGSDGLSGRLAISTEWRKSFGKPELDPGCERRGGLRKVEACSTDCAKPWKSWPERFCTGVDLVKPSPMPSIIGRA